MGPLATAGAIAAGLGTATLAGVIAATPTRDGEPASFSSSTLVIGTIGAGGAVAAGLFGADLLRWAGLSGTASSLAGIGLLGVGCAAGLGGWLLAREAW